MSSQREPLLFTSTKPLGHWSQVGTASIVWHNTRGSQPPLSRRHGSIGGGPASSASGPASLPESWLASEASNPASPASGPASDSSPGKIGKSSGSTNAGAQPLTLHVSSSSHLMPMQSSSSTSFT